MKKIGLGVGLAFFLQIITGLSVFAVADSFEIYFQDATHLIEHSGQYEPQGTWVSLANGSKGKYWFNVPEDGAYTLRVSYISIADETPKVTIDGEEISVLTMPKVYNEWGANEVGYATLATLKLSAGRHETEWEWHSSIAAQKMIFEPFALTDITSIPSSIVSDTTGTQSGSAIVINSGEYAEFELTSTAENLYNLTISSACEEKDAYLEIMINDSVVKTVKVRQTNSLERFTVYYAGTIQIPNGNLKLRITAVDKTVSLKSLKLDKYDPEGEIVAGSVINIVPIDFIHEEGEFFDTTPDKNELSEDNSQNEHMGVEYSGSSVYIYTDEWLNYNAEFPESGEYFFYMTYGTRKDAKFSIIKEDGTTFSLNKLPNTGDNHTKTELLLGTVNFDAGMQKFTYKMTEGQDVEYSNLKFVKKPESLELCAALADENIITSSPVNRGAEKIVFYFSEAIDPEANISVDITENEKKINCDYEVSDKVMLITLRDTFDYDTEYNINLSGVKAESGCEYKQDKPISFTTCSEGEDSGTGAIASLEGNFDENVLTMSGVATTKSGVKISGRKVYATLKNGTQEYTTDAVICDKNGEFTINYTLPEGAPEGTYTVNAYAEYSTAKKSVTARYISKNTEQEIIDAIKATETYSQVQEIFDNTYYYESLGLNGKSTVKTLDAEKYYTHFIGKTYASAKEIVYYYNRYLVFEQLNQGKSVSKVKKVLYNEDNCQYLGIDYEKLNLIKTNASSLVADVIRMEDYTDDDEFVKDLNVMINDMLIKEYNKITPEIAVSDTSTYVGKRAVVNVGFVSGIEDVAKIVYEIICPSKEVANDAEVTASEAEITTTVEDNKIIVNIIPNEKTEFELSIYFSTSGVYNFKVNAYIEYTLEQEKTCSVTANEKAFTVNVSANSSKGTSSGGGGGGSKPSSYSPLVLPQNPQTGTEDNKESSDNNTFADIESVGWAKANIENLVKKGIISMPEDKKFRPNDNVTREEFVKMIVMAFNLYDENAKCEFADAKADEWYMPYIASAAQGGIVNGNDDGSFGVGKNITRQEMAAMLSRILEKLNKSETKYETDEFADNEEIANWAKEAVYQMKSMGIMNGIEEGRFAPEQHATRAMSARVIDILMSEVTQ